MTGRNMLREEDLKTVLERIDRRGYKAYRDIRGDYDFGDFTVIIDHVQADPFASPSRVRVKVPQKAAGFPADAYGGRSREVGLRDFLARRFHEAARRLTKGSRGAGKSGIISIDRPGQEVLERSSCHVNGKFVEARFVMGLPASGRTIAGKEAGAMFFSELPDIVRASLFFPALDHEALYEHIRTVEDADHLRNSLSSLGLIAFVADGSILPRASGIDMRPMTGKWVVPFSSPPSVRCEIDLPNRGRISGMGIRRGITLVVGGGYHGKSTLLNAIELGIYNHVPGDGREFVVASPGAVKIRAEDGRRIEKVDISPFIANLPDGQASSSFSTDDASGSTSQAANIMEALEAGAEVILLDEDTSATNFMIRDRRMQELVHKDREPITPFIDKVTLLHREEGVSTVLVMGGSGDYLDVADCVICMDEYVARDVTDDARGVAASNPSRRLAEGGLRFGTRTPRVPLPGSFDARRGSREVKISPKGTCAISFGASLIDLAAIEQLVDTGQTRAIGDAIYHAVRHMDGKRLLADVLALVMRDVEEKGLDILGRQPAGDYASFRMIELAAAINRLRTLRVRQAEKNSDQD